MKELKIGDVTISFHNGWVPNLSHVRLERVVKALGNSGDLASAARDLNALGFFSRATSNSTDCRQLWVNEAWGVILKTSYFLGHAPPRAVPTATIVRRGKYEVIAQPIVDVSAKALKKFKKLEGDRGRWDGEKFGSDAHRGNIGMYDGKPVVFDW